jgi:hypothetical protein
MKSIKTMVCGIGMHVALTLSLVASTQVFARDYEVQASLSEQGNVIATQTQIVSSSTQNSPLVLHLDSYDSVYNGQDITYNFGSQFIVNIGQNRNAGKTKGKKSNNDDYLYVIIVQPHRDGYQNSVLPVIANDEDTSDSNTNNDADANQNNDFYAFLPKVNDNETESFLVLMAGKPVNEIKKTILIHDKENFLHHLNLDIQVQDKK